MTLAELKKKYGSDSIILMIDHLLHKVELNPHSQAIYTELKNDLKSLLSNP